MSKHPTGSHDAQTIDEMLEDMETARTNGLLVKRGQSLYKMQSGEYQKDELRALVDMNIHDVAEFATREKVSLSDIDEVRKRTLLYLKACSESGTFPSLLGLARSLGYSVRALNYWRTDRAQTETAQWLEMCSDTFADILSQSALRNNAQPIVSIFLSKALYQLRDSTEVIFSKGAEITQEDSFNVNDIRKRYLIDTDYEGGISNDTERT